MIKSSEAYRAAITGDTRRILLRALVDIIDPDIVYGAGATSGQSVYSKPAQLHDKVFDAPRRYATLERDRWALDGTFDLFPDEPAETVGDVGYLGDTLAGEGGVFADAPWVEMQFSGVSVLQACSVYFSTDPLDSYPVDFKVEVKQGGTAYFTREFTGNKAYSVSMDGFTVNNPDAICVTVSRWSRASRRFRAVEIVPGIYESWDGDMLATFACKQQGDVSCLALPYGTCTLAMDNLSRRFEPRKKAGLFQSITERQAIDVSIGVKLEDGTRDYKRVGMFYQYSGGWKTGDNGLTMQWDLVDIVGLLANREYIVPAVLPITLSGWIASLVSQLGPNFTESYTVDAAYADLAVTADSKETVTGKKCGDVLRWACMATATWPRADAESGKLAVEPLWNEGNKLDLDNLTGYPVMKANNDLAAILFTLSDKTEIVVSGNDTAASETVRVENPFLHTQAQALAAARNILACYGGNRLELTGRGDPSSEIGDVDTVWLDESSATTARRIYQTFQFSDGVLQGCQSTLLQADGSFLFTERAVITQSGTWTAPAGKKKLFAILVGHGSNGTPGTAGTWEAAGEDGVDGVGGLVWADTININEQQAFPVTIGQDTVFGAYSSANGKRYTNGYTDVRSGDSFGRSGVRNPIPGSGNGGIRGIGGVKGNTHQETRTHKFYDENGNVYWEDVEVTIIDNQPGDPEPPSTGVRGCVVVYWEKEET